MLSSGTQFFTPVDIHSYNYLHCIDTLLVRLKYTHYIDTLSWATIWGGGPYKIIVSDGLGAGHRAGANCNCILLELCNMIKTSTVQEVRVVKRCNCFIAKATALCSQWYEAPMPRIPKFSFRYRSPHCVFHADAKVIIPRPCHAFVTFS
jgi:hypothetical protein